MVTAKKDNKIDPEVLKEFIANNPSILKDAIEKLGIKPQGEQSYTIIGVTEKELPLYSVKDTKLVQSGTKVSKFFLVRTLNGNVLSIPEHCLKDYNIDITHGGAVVNEDGLTVGEQNNAILNGAY